MDKKITNRIDFVYVFDVKDGNPNGDPDNSNAPRVDQETGQGLVTDVCLKRKIRNYIQIREKEDEKRNLIFVRSKDVSGKECFLNSLVDKAYEEIGVEIEDEKDAEGKKTGKKKRMKDADKVDLARNFMCSHYYDVRTFGAVMSTGRNAGQVRGPVQMTFARSADPVWPAKHAITVCAAKDESKSFESQTGIQGTKYTIPYGLYSCYGFVSPGLAEKTGFDTDDLSLLWDALKGMFDEDRSAARGLMTPRAIIAFKHRDALGKASSGTLFSLVSIRKKDGVKTPGSFNDYVIDVDEKNVPEGVSIERIL